MHLRARVVAAGGRAQAAGRWGVGRSSPPLEGTITGVGAASDGTARARRAATPGGGTKSSRPWGSTTRKKQAIEG